MDLGGKVPFWSQKNEQTRTEKLVQEIWGENVKYGNLGVKIVARSGTKMYIFWLRKSENTEKRWDNPTITLAQKFVPDKYRCTKKFPGSH